MDHGTKCARLRARLATLFDRSAIARSGKNSRNTRFTQRPLWAAAALTGAALLAVCPGTSQAQGTGTYLWGPSEAVGACGFIIVRPRNGYRTQTEALQAALKAWAAAGCDATVTSVPPPWPGPFWYGVAGGAIRVSPHCDDPDGGVSAEGLCNYTFRNSPAKQAGCEAPCLRGNPINYATGNKTLHEVDYSGTGPLPLRFARSYNSIPTRAWLMSNTWMHSYQRSVEYNPETPKVVSNYRASGRVLSYRSADGMSFTADPDVADRITKQVDAGGQLTGWQVRSAQDDELEEYDALGRLIAISNRAGLAQTLTYSDGTANPPNGGVIEGSAAPLPAGLLLRVSDPFGRSLEFGYDAALKLVRLTDPDQQHYQYGYDAEGNVASVTYPSGHTRTYHYNEPGLSPPNSPYHLTGITDENSARYASYGYDNSTSKRANLTKHHAGATEVNQYQYVYGVGFNPPTETDPLGVSRILIAPTMHGVARNTSISGPACPSSGPAAQSYDANGYRTSATDWNGNQACFKHDARGLETARGEGLSGACPSSLEAWVPAAGTVQRKITTEWHPTWRLPTRIAEPKRITTYVYGEPSDPSPGNRGSVLAKTIQATSDTSGGQGFAATPVGTPRTWTYAYDANGQVLTADGPRSDAADVTTYGYFPNDDAEVGRRGSLATITNALGHVTEISAYNAHGQPLTIVDPNGLTTRLAYDPRQRLTSRTVGGETTSYQYDGVGQLTQVNLPDGSFLSYTYDTAHRLTEIADNLGNRIAYTLDAMGNRTREDVLDPASQLAQTRSRVYSNLNRLVQEIGGTNPAAQITSYAYDNQGNLTSITDPLNRVTANAYDTLNRLKQITDPASGGTAYGYDGLDQLSSVTDPRSNTTGYTLDGLGNLTAQASPDTGTGTSTHDAAGNLLTSTDAKGQLTSYTYDALNRVTRIVYDQAIGTQLKQVDYAYDQGANGIGRLTSITETSAAAAVLQTTAYGYDQIGRIASETRVIGGQTYTTAYAYDAAGRMTGMTYPSGRTTSYGFDALGRVNRIETTGGGETRVVVQDVTYHPSGPIKGFTFGNLQTYARSFDLDGRIVTHTLADQTKALSFDAASRITAITQQGNPANTSTYGYDALDRLTNAVLPTSTFAFGYDPVGNRSTKSIGGSTDTYAYSPASNRLAAITGASGTRSYVHDPNGSITSDGLDTHGYDARGRLVSTVSAAGATSYQVNALGQRARKTSSLGDTVFHYDTQGRLIAESSPAGTPIREYLWLAYQPVAVAAHGQAGGGCPANPVVDSSDSFVPFAHRERMEVHSGRPGERGWEWGLGTNTRDFDATARADLDWVSGKPYGFVLSYDGAGNARVTVRDGAVELFTLTWTGGMDVGNALRFMVKSPAGIGAGNRISVLITSIDGQPVADTLATAGDDAFSQVVRVYAGASLQNGYSLEGSVTFTFTKSYPPRGNKLDFTVTAGTVTCQGSVQAGPPVLHYVHADHLNTPRAISNDAQQLVWRWEYQEPFGRSPPEENPSGLGNFEFNLRFPGQYRDAETGLFYNYYRDYDPQTGRYVQSDPIGLAGGINTYLYVAGNPVSFVDPDGRQAMLPPDLDPFSPGFNPPQSPLDLGNAPPPQVGQLSNALMYWGVGAGVGGVVLVTAPAMPEIGALACRAAPAAARTLKEACKNPLMAFALGTSICASSTEPQGKPPGSARQYSTDRRTLQELRDASERARQANPAGFNSLP